MKKPFYLTTTLPYVNAKPHIGHAVEFVRADVLARFKQKEGFDVFFNTGTDEHGQKIYEAATEKGLSPQEYVDGNHLFFKKLLVDLHIASDVHFIRTTDDVHVAAAIEFWNRVMKNGYIYKKKYVSKYCVGCELEKTDSELVDGHCPDHPNKELLLIDEENYFFKFSAFQDRLMELYTNNPTFVIPDIRQKEIASFVSSGLKDFSISRLKSKAPWGIPVPGDEDHTMYVWFDALTSYISTLGWPGDEMSFDKYWRNGNPTQYCGQDNLRQQSAMWQAMLMAADLPNSYQIIINGFVTGAGGVKMSKTIGNVIDPLVLQSYYGTDAVRYYLLRHIHPFTGSPITYDSFHEAYNADLVNGIGNLSSRLLALTEKYIETPEIKKIDAPAEFTAAMNDFRFDLACTIIWDEISRLDKDISVTEPFKLIKTDPETAKTYLNDYLSRLSMIADSISVILPETSTRILTALAENKKPAPVFERKEKIVIA